jgi:hypothetical protein
VGVQELREMCAARPALEQNDETLFVTHRIALFEPTKRSVPLS